MKGILLLLLLCSSGNGFGLSNQSPKERVDKVEFNTSYIYKVSAGKVVPQYTQMIIWEWNAEYRRHDIVQFFIIEDNDNFTLNKIGRIYYISYISADSILYNLQTEDIVYTKSWADDDPELENGKLLPPEFRRKLTGKKL